MSLTLLGAMVAADLHAGVEIFVGNFEIVFKLEVAVFLRRAKERVGSVGCARADNFAVFNAVGGIAAAFDPAFQVLSIKQLGRVVGVCQSRDQDRNEDNLCDA